jgi:hypothetical protein
METGGSGGTGTRQGKRNPTDHLTFTLSLRDCYASGRRDRRAERNCTWCIFLESAEE